MTTNSLQGVSLSAMTKSEMYDELWKFGRDLVRAEMAKVISEVRGVSLKEAKDQKTLRPGEVAELRRRFA